MTQFDVVIVNWNAGDMLFDCVESLFESVEAGWIGDVVVVDNGSTDSSLSRLADSRTPCTLIRSDTNLGFGAACNRGARACRAPWIVFLNPDMRLERSPFPQIDAVAERADVGVIGIKLVNEDRVVQRHTEAQPNLPGLIFRGLGVFTHLPSWIDTGRRLEWDHESSADVGHVIGAFYCIRRTLFTDLGGFDRRFFVYFEDMDLSRRVLDSGYRIHYLASAWAVHIGGGVTSKVKARRLFLVQNGRAHYARKHMGVAAAVLVIGAMLSVELLLRCARGAYQRELTQVLRAAGMLAASIPDVLAGRPAR